MNRRDVGSRVRFCYDSFASVDSNAVAGMAMVSADLRGKAAIVTGGASGIGLSTARLFAQCGAKVALNDLPGNPALATQVDSLKKQGLDVLAAPGDVGKPEEARRMVNDAVRSMGRLDYLINNAGGGFTEQAIPPADLDSLSDDLWDRILDVNLKGAFHCTHAASDHLKRVGGAVVNNASTAGLGINQGSSIVYAASKAALSNLTRGLAKAMGPSVRVNAVAPGHIRTPRTDRLGEEHRQRSVSRTALRRAGTSEEVAEVMLFLCAGAGYVTGQTLVVDGGM